MVFEIEKNPVGRPSGTKESIESLSKKSAQRDLKLLEHTTKVAEKEQGRIEEALAKAEVGSEEYEKLYRLLLLGRESLIKNIAMAARIAATDPTKASEGDSSEALSEYHKQIQGDGQ